MNTDYKDNLVRSLERSEATAREWDWNRPVKPGEDFHIRSEEEPTDGQIGQLHVLYVDWQALNPKLSAMSPHYLIGRWTECDSWAEMDADGSWGGPVKAVTHWKPLRLSCSE